MKQQQFFQATSHLPQQQQQFFQTQSTEKKDLAYFIHELSESVRNGGDTEETWNNIFAVVSMKTTLSDEDQKVLHKIFSMIVRSPNREIMVHSFMKQLKQSTLNHPRITKHFLRQLFPVEMFPRSIHKYSHMSFLGPIFDYMRFLLFQTPTKKFQKQLVQFIGDFQTRQPEKTVSVDSIQKTLPPHIRLEFQQFLKKKPSDQQTQKNEQVISKFKTEFEKYRRQKQSQQQTDQQTQQQSEPQQMSLKQLSNHINAIVFRPEYKETPLIEKFIKIIVILDLIQKENPQIVQDWYPILQQHFFKKNQVISQKNVFDRILLQKSAYFHDIHPKMDPTYLQQTVRLLQEARKKSTIVSLEVLTVIALLGLKNQISANDIKFGLKLIIGLKEKNDPRFDFLFEEMRHVILDKGKKILQQKRFQQKQIVQDLKFVDQTLTNVKNNKKMKLLLSLSRINNILGKLGLSL